MGLIAGATVTCAAPIELLMSTTMVHDYRFLPPFSIAMAALAVGSTVWSVV
ncbi:MAG: hypothetical protein ACJAYE_002611 [Candidatus Azotimanducaceae bacterium]|jgi:hypothetical protein